MSASLLYHAWGLRGYRLVRTRFEKGRIWFDIEHDEASLAARRGMGQSTARIS